MAITKIVNEDMYATYLSLDEFKLLDNIRRGTAIERQQFFNLAQTFREHCEKRADATNVVAIRPQRVAIRRFGDRTRPTKSPNDGLTGE